MSWDPAKHILMYLGADIHEQKPKHTNEIGACILGIRRISSERDSKVIVEDRVTSSMLWVKGLKCRCIAARWGHCASWSWSLDFKKHTEKYGQLVKNYKNYLWSEQSRPTHLSTTKWTNFQLVWLVHSNLLLREIALNSRSLQPSWHRLQHPASEPKNCIN